jgi:hypothetical protein
MRISLWLEYNVRVAYEPVAFLGPIALRFDQVYQPQSSENSELDLNAAAQLLALSR